MFEALSCTDCLGEETSRQSLKEQDASAQGLRKAAERSAAETLVVSVDSLAPVASSVQSAASVTSVQLDSSERRLLLELPLAV